MLFAEHDEFGVNKELLLSVSGAALTVLSGLILLAIDPSDLSYDNVFMWEWFVWLSGVWPMLLWTGGQILIGRREQARERAFEEAALASEGKLRELLGKDTMLRSLEDDGFLAFCERQFVFENVAFLRDVSAFKTFYFDKAKGWRRAKGLHLLETFCVEGAPLQVNVSHAARLRAEEAVRGGGDSVPFEAFDEMFDDVVRMMVHEAWRLHVLQLVARGGDIDAGVKVAAAKLLGGS